MAKMGGLAKIFTKTHWFFLVGALALSGIPPFAAFFSKDLILDQEYLSGYEALYYIGLAASILTGVYMMRAYCLTFLGPVRLSEEELKTVHEAPRVMLIPVGLLTLLAIGGGLLGFTLNGSPLLEGFLSEVGVTPIEEELRSGFVLTMETWIAIAGAFLGVGLTALTYTRFANRLGPPIGLLAHQFYINEIYDRLFVRPLIALSNAIVNFFEPEVFDGLVGGSIKAAQGAAMSFQMLQSGQIRSYIAWMVLGSVLIIAYFIL